MINGTRTSAILSLFFFIFNCNANAQKNWAAVGKIVEKIAIDKVIDSRTPFQTLGDFKGKITILEFWATWCGPCIFSMEHLQKLKGIYKDKINIVAISNEGEDKVRGFLKTHNLPFLFVVDTTKRLNDYFPKQTIPHTILLDKNLKVLAITYPQNITEEVIDLALDGKESSLFLKKYEIYENNKEYFYPNDSLTDTKFQLLDAISSLPFGRLEVWGGTPFYGRRLTRYNSKIEELFMDTYRDVHIKNTLYDSSLTDIQMEKLYCVDLVVRNENRDSLFTDMRKYLTLSLGIKSRIGLEDQDVYVLTKIEDFNFTKSKKETLIYEVSQPKTNGFTAENVPISKFIDKFSEWIMYPVIDETSLLEKYDINFEFDYSNPIQDFTQNTNFNKSLQKCGFKIEKAIRKASTLILFK